MRHINSETWKLVALAAALGAISCSGEAPSASTDEHEEHDHAGHDHGGDEAPQTVDDLPVGDVLAWQLQADAAQPAIVEGYQVQRAPAETQDEGELLYEIRLSPTKVVQFLELEPGELVVSYTGSDTLDPLPPEAYSELSPAEVFTQITGEPAPERLLNAEQLASELDALRAESGVDEYADSLEGGPGEVGMTPLAEGPEREFLASQWWIETACSAAGIPYHFTSGSEFYHRYVGCWANPFTAVHTGELGISWDFRAVWDGTNGAVGTFKHWWISCNTYLGIKVCDWESSNHTTEAGHWRQLNFSGRKTRAADYTNPNGGYFALKFNAPYSMLFNSLECVPNTTPEVDCIYHNQ